MNNKIFFDTINYNTTLKTNIVNEYLRRNVLPKLQETYNTCRSYETYLGFLNGNIYRFKLGDPICDIIDDIDNNAVTFENYKLQIIGKINDFIDFVTERIKIKLAELKTKYFHLESIRFSVITQHDTISIQYFYNGACYSTYDLIRFEEIFTKSCNENEIDNLLDRILTKHSKRLVGIDFEMSIQSLFYFDFSSEIVDDKILKKSGYNKDILVISDRVLYDKDYFEHMIVIVKQMFEDEVKLKYIHDFINDYEFKTMKLCNNKKFDLNLGIWDINYDYHNDINNFYEQIKNVIETYNYLRKSASLIEMKDILLMDRLSIKYQETKKIDNDEYVIYLCRRKKSKQYIFFKNGARIGRSKYHEVARATGYCFDIDVNKMYKVDWDVISRMPLSKEKIELYRDKLNWKLISRHRPLDNDMLTKYAKYIDWEYILLNRNVRWKTITKLAPIIGWDVISKYWKGLNEKFIQTHLYDLNMELVYQNPSCKSFKDTIEILMS